MKSEKTISCNSNGMVISYGDVNKHQFVRYQTPKYVEKIQIEGTVKYQTIESDFNPVQEDLYQKIVYGFNAYTKKELDSLSKSKKFKISVDYTKARRILNRWKQEIVDESVNMLFLKMFPKSPITKQITSVKGYDDNLQVNISFKDLGVSKHKIAAKLIEFGILPNNFYQLN